MEIEEARRKLRVYRALDNKVRLKALKAISEKPGMSFNSVSREANVERGLLAYHLGVLKAAGLVDVRYRRTSKKTSEYKLTQLGKEHLQDLFARAEPKKKIHKRNRRKI